MSITFAIDVRVYFEDTDFSGRVYHGAYIRFLERGRSELIRAAGLDHRALADQAKPVYFTLRRIDVSFHAPAVIDDLVRVETTPVASGRHRPSSKRPPRSPSRSSATRASRWRCSRSGWAGASTLPTW